MATRNIAIREEVYKKLCSAKREDESFSDAIDRLLSKKSSLLPFAGVFGENDADLKVIEKEVKSLRKRAVYFVDGSDRVRNDKVLEGALYPLSSSFFLI